MLAHADAEIARRDPAVPALALVLDPEALADRLREGDSFHGLESARANYVRYKPGTSCLVGYELDLPERRVLGFVKAFRREDRAKLSKAACKAGPGDVVTLDGDHVAVVEVTGDRDLPLARRLAQPGDRHRLIRSLIPDLPELWDATPHPLRYKPERRWVGVMRSSGEPAVLVKGYRRADLPRALAGLRLADSLPLTTPQLLGASTAAGGLATSWIPGEPLSEVLAGPLATTALVDTGRALAVLHRRPGGRLRRVSTAGDVAAVTAAAAAVTAVVPRLGPVACRLGGAVSQQLVARTALATPRHGDFSPDQVVLGASGAAIVDFDNAAVGDPAADLGQFLASLELTVLDGSLAAGRVGELSADLLTGYESAGGPADPERVSTHRAAALVRLAVEPFRRRQPEWPTRTGEILDLASSLASPGAACG